MVKRGREGEAPSEPRGGTSSNMETAREYQALLNLLLVDWMGCGRSLTLPMAAVHTFPNIAICFL